MKHESHCKTTICSPSACGVCPCTCIPRGETCTEAVTRTDIENLRKVGFTELQAKALIEIITRKALSGGMF